MILDRLKEATRPRHERIEEVVGLGRSPFDHPSYRKLLESFLGFYRPIEARLGRIDWGGSPEILAGRLKSDRLRRDLAALGATDAEIDGLPRCPSLPRCDRAADGWGILYVLEGSTLGGVHLAREVERTLGLGPDVAVSFFRAYRDQVGPRWRAFRDALTAEVGPEDESAVIASAEATFDALTDWLPRGPHAPGGDPS